MKAIRLKTEHLFNPLGIDVVHPRLMWNCEGGVRQTAYQIIAGSWDSGKQEGSSMQAVYPLDLADCERVCWKVRLWDENDKPGDWSEAFFETGISSWSAQWITGNYTVDKNTRYPVDCFRKVFPVAKAVASARLYITACGLYEARLGGEKVGTFCMAPGYTDYRTRVQYQAYDVTDMLHDGVNELTVQLADGWYRGSCGAWGIKNQYGTETKLMAQLEIRYEDGTTQTVATDGTWQWSNDGAIRFADNKDGEIVDARQTPCFGGKAKVTSHNVVPSASNNVPVCGHERFTPTLSITPSGKKVLDFGQNIQGVVSFSVNAHEGQRIFLRMGEMLGKDGEFTQANIQLTNKKGTTPLQQVEFFCREGVNDYTTTFAVFGFQYALVETDVDFSPEDFRSIALYSDLERTGWFESSNALLNQFFESTVWSAKSNHMDIPTDCPTRERHGWTGDAQLFFTSAAYLFDFAPFARKYLRDVFDWQRKDGRLPHIVPDGGADFYMWTMNGSVGWSDVGVLIPWRYAQIYQEKAILEQYYDGMAAYARFMERRCGKTALPTAELIRLPSKEARRYLVNDGQSYGEWAEPAELGGGFRWQDFVAPHPEVSTAYTSYILGLMAKIAAELGHPEDAEEFQTVSDGCRTAYQELVATDKYSLDTDMQARLVRPLYMGLLDDVQTAYAKKRLIEALEHFGWRLGTGFLSTPFILYVLASYDLDAAYKLLENEEIPGWLSMPKAGATTIWEDWAGPDSKEGGIGSLNHYSKGAVVEWLFSSMCGIQVASENHFVIAPLPGGSFTHAKARYTSIFGTVESGWEKTEDGKVTYRITVPANCEAEVRLPDGFEQVLGAGTHLIEGK